MEPINALTGVRKLHEYGEQRRHIFPSDNSLTWFVRQHRDELIERGAMLLLNKQWHVNDHQFDLAVLEVGKKAAQQRRDEPPLRPTRRTPPPSPTAAAA
jgi:hypothetical protein